MGKLKQTKNKQLFDAKFPQIYKWKENAQGALTSYLKVEESEGKSGNSSKQTAWHRIAANLKGKVKHAQRFYKLFKTKWKRGKEGKFKRPPHRVIPVLPVLLHVD